ncbi:MAG: plastocyanin/azurin family copper-binding protein [Nitrososphaeraceae archaeon]
MSIRSAIKAIILILSVTNIMCMVILNYDNSLMGNVFATSEEDENGDSDDDGNEINDTNGSDEEQQETNNDNDAGDVYQIIIPEGAAYSETTSERFDPAELHVLSGSTVEWVNQDDIIHTVTSGKETGYGLFEHAHDGIFDSGSLDGGESFTFQFEEPGRYEYFCIPHPWMNGVVVSM